MRLWLAVLLLISTSILRGQAVVQNAHSTNCGAVNLNDVKGNVQINQNCEESAPETLKGMLRELQRHERGEQAAHAEANAWRAKYEQLLLSVAQIPQDDEALRAGLDRALQKRDFTSAHKLVDEALEKDVTKTRIAQLQYIHGQIFELQSDFAQASTHYEVAHKLFPMSVPFAFSYGNSLLVMRRFPEAATVFDGLVHAGTLAPNQKEELAAALMNVATAQAGSGNLEKLSSEYTEAYKLFDESARTGSLASRRNAAYAQIGLADIYQHRRDFVRAAAAFDAAIREARLGLEPDGTGRYQLAGVLVIVSEFRLTQNHVSDAMPSIEEAVAIYAELAGKDVALQPRYQATYAHSLIVEARVYLVAHDLTKARKAGEQAVSLYDKLTASNPDQYRIGRGGAHQVLGAIGLMLEDGTDQKELALAVDNYERAPEVLRRENVIPIARAKCYLGVALLRRGDVPSALERAGSSLDALESLPTQVVIDSAGDVVDDAAFIFEAAGHPDKAEQAHRRWPAAP